MKLRLLLSALAIAACLSSSALAKTQSCTSTFSATGHMTLFSFDGVNYAGLSDVTWKVKCKNQPTTIFTGQDLAENSFSETPCTFTGPDGNSETGITGTLVAGVAVARNSTTGDMVFSEDVSGSTCFNTSTTDFASKANSKYTGGTGKYAGATGTATGNSVGSNLAAPSSPGFGFFAWSTGSGTGTITLP